MFSSAHKRSLLCLAETTMGFALSSALSPATELSGNRSLRLSVASYFLPMLLISEWMASCCVFYPNANTGEAQTQRLKRTLLGKAVITPFLGTMPTWLSTTEPKTLAEIACIGSIYLFVIALSYVAQLYSFRSSAARVYPAPQPV